MLRLYDISMFAFLSVGVLSRHWVYRGELWMKALILTDKDGRLAQDPTKPRTAGLLGVSSCSGQSCFRILKWTLTLLLFYDLFYFLRPTPSQFQPGFSSHQHSPWNEVKAPQQYDNQGCGQKLPKGSFGPAFNSAGGCFGARLRGLELLMWKSRCRCLLT